MNLCAFLLGFTAARRALLLISTPPFRPSALVARRSMHQRSWSHYHVQGDDSMCTMLDQPCSTLFKKVRQDAVLEPIHTKQGVLRQVQRSALFHLLVDRLGL